MEDRELRRRRWLINRKLEGCRSLEIATALRIDERTVYRWWHVYRKDGWASLHVKSHRPHTIHRTPQETVDLILQRPDTSQWIEQTEVQISSLKLSDGHRSRT
jgi:transposase